MSLGQTDFYDNSYSKDKGFVNFKRNNTYSFGQ